MKLDNVKLLVTHGGVFHADDVFSTALIYLCKVNKIYTDKNVLDPRTGSYVIDIIDNAYKYGTYDPIVRRYDSDIPLDKTVPVVVRTNSIRDAESYPELTLIYDIGGGLFDHHQANAKLRPDGMKYCAFGLLFSKFGDCLIPDEGVRESFYSRYVAPIDDTDNGVGPNPLSSAISAFMPNWNEDNDPESVNKAFADAVLIAVRILSRMILKANATYQATEILESSPTIETDGGKILILREYVPYNTWAFEKGFSAAVYPSNRGGYNCCVISDPKAGNICKFPVDWRGISDENYLKEISGIDGITFCHASGFLIATKTQLSAIEASGFLEPCVAD